MYLTFRCNCHGLKIFLLQNNFTVRLSMRIFILCNRFEFKKIFEYIEIYVLHLNTFYHKR